ncbi:MAG: trehalose/maltose transport system permease protein [Thermoanaerobacteraceae bacterium]|nr:trehalose/maltose transport system permease protein [Thermoanaerobacteraceae bacterium]MDN5301173.1 trehalose/maltose transport system permease protein [Thermoanaerobacteraceae bacterium]
MRSHIKLFLYYLVVSIIVIYCVFPFLWQIITALKTPEQVFKMPPDWLPEKFYLNNFHEVFKTGKFVAYLRNSLIVSSVTTIICIIFGSLGGYAISRFKFAGKGIILSSILAISIFPQIIVIGPLFLFFSRIGILNTHLSLIIPYVAFNLPLTIWILTNFYKDIPIELEEAAKVDGCNLLQLLIKIILPVSAPGIFTASMLIFINAWNEFILALTFTYNEASRTVPVGIAMFPGLHFVPWDTIAAASVIVTLPLVLMVLIFQNKVIAGLTAGSVKG